LRFRQVLVPKDQYFIILLYNWQIKIEKMLFQGTEILDRSIEFVDVIKAPPLSEVGNDYLDAINSMLKAFKKHEILGNGGGQPL